MQSFAEKLFARLQGCTERFEVLFLLYWSADVHLLHDNDMKFVYLDVAEGMFMLDLIGYHEWTSIRSLLWVVSPHFAYIARLIFS